MTKIGPDEYSAIAGEVVRITVQSVNFVINANLDPKLTPVGSVNDFSKAGELTMGNSNATFAVNYNFPKPLPAGGKYTRTITGPGGFTDGPFDVAQIGDESSETLPYVVKLAPAPAGRQ
jgi:hypothetical protein